MKYYRPAQDWRSNMADAVELRFGAFGVQAGLIWGVAKGFGLVLWSGRDEPLFSRNWFAAA